MVARKDSYLLVLVTAFGLVGMTACDEDLDPNGVVLDEEVADDDHIDFTPVDEERTFRTIVDNGTESNTLFINGLRLNGLRLNGLRLNGVELSSVNRFGSAMASLQLTSGSLLSAWDTGSNSTKFGAQLNNMIFNLLQEPEGGGTAVMRKLKILDVVQSAAQSDVYFYTVQNETSPNVWESACTDPLGNPVDAIALKKHWNLVTATRENLDDAITWACRGAALAKAVEWGYRPWASHAGTPLEDYHEAAVRMIRADYCGDGVHHTTNGNPIDVADRLGIQVSDTTWPVEAKWGPDGAVCLNTPRKLYHPRSSLWCASSLPTCSNTDPSEYGGLLMTRAVPNNN